jgi:phage gp45-like
MNDRLHQELNDLRSRVQRLESKSQHFIMQATQLEPTYETLTATTRLSIVGNGVVSDVGIHQDYGFASRSLPGSQHTLVNIGGLNGNGRSISTTDERYRPLGLLAGDSAQYDYRGQLIWLTNNTINIIGTGNINITAPAGLTINANSTINGSLQLNGAMIATGNGTFNGIDVDTHVHTGVQTGSGRTGGPTG